MIRITCKNCGKKLEAPEEAAGGRGECPRCNEVFDVPGIPDSDCQDASELNEGALLRGLGKFILVSVILGALVYFLMGLDAVAQRIHFLISGLR